MARRLRFVYAQAVSSVRARRRIEQELQRLTALVRLAPIALRRWRELPQMRRLLERPIVVGGCGRSGRIGAGDAKERRQFPRILEQQVQTHLAWGGKVEALMSAKELRVELGYPNSESTSA